MPEDTANDGSPILGVGSFHFRAATQRTMLQQTPTTDPKPCLNVLENLANREFKGKGFHNIFRPRSMKPLDGVPVPGNPSTNDLGLKLTHETLKFSKVIGTVPNQGLAEQPDIVLGGVMYVQSVQDVTNQKTGKADGNPVDIHIETGMWVSVPATPESGIPVATLCRMGSIPHGTSINAQGAQPEKCGHPDPPNISPISVTPFHIGDPSNKVKFPSQQLGGKNNRIPQDLDPFNVNGVITQDILDNLTTILRNDLSKQNIVRTITWDIDTLAVSPLDGGGTANIAFLSGAGATTRNGGNAFAASMNATFWLETVELTFTVPGGLDEPHNHQPYGEFGPTFVIPPTTGRSSSTEITVTYLQLQYRQTVFLNFGHLTWPHVAVATLADTTGIHVSLPPA